METNCLERFVMNVIKGTPKSTLAETCLKASEMCDAINDMVGGPTFTIVDVHREIARQWGRCRGPETIYGGHPMTAWIREAYDMVELGRDADVSRQPFPPAEVWQTLLDSCPLKFPNELRNEPIQFTVHRPPRSDATERSDGPAS